MIQFRSKLLSDAGIYTLSNFAVAGVPFLLLPVLTRALDPDAFGIISMFSMMVAFISIGIGLNMQGAVAVRYYDRSIFDINKYVSTVILILTLMTGLMICLVFVVGASVAKMTSIPKAWLYVAVLVAYLQFLVQVLLALWQASKMPIRFGTLRISHALLDAISSITLVVILALSWQGRLSGILAAWLFIAIISAYFLFREGWLSKSIDPACAKDAFGFGLPLIPHAVGGLLLAMADRFMVTNILDVASTGIYVVAVQLGLILGIFADSFNKAFAPWLMEKLNNMDFNSQRRIVIYTYIYFVAILAFASIGAVISPYLLPFIVGPQFQAAGSMLVYILFGNAFIGMYYMVTNYIFYRRRTGLLSMLTISVGLIMLCLSWFLINEYGVVGAAMAFMIGQAILFLGAWVLSNFCVPMPWFKLFSTKASV